MKQQFLPDGPKKRLLLKALLLVVLQWAVVITSYAAVVLDVSGKVTDEKGEALPGVTVLVKGSTVGTTTNANGEFTLATPQPTGTLIFSFVGFITKEVPFANATRIQVTLAADAKALEEVVVVGYGTQSKRNVTGSVTSVNVEQMESQPNTNVTQALRGRVAGVQFTDNGRPGQSGNIIVRGQRSITASNDPLIVLDGAFYNGALADINPNDIESMEVLKDASAAAIYGARAANGVILITSKKGVSAKPVIRFNTYYGVSGWSYKMPLFSADRYLQRRLDFRAQNQPQAAPVPVRDLLSAAEKEMYDAGRTLDPWETVSQDASQKSYNVSVAGRTDRTNYFISGSYVDEDGLIYGDRASRVSLRLNLENKITDWLAVGINSQFAQRDMSGLEASLLNAFWLSPYSKMYLDEAQTDLVIYPTGDDLVFNPLFNARQRDNEEISNNLFANTYFNIEAPFVKGLSYRFNYNPNIRWGRNYTFIPIYQRQNVNNVGEGTKTNNNIWDWQLENIVTYTREIQDHAFDLTLLYGQNRSFREGTQVNGRGLVNDANGWNNLDIAQTQRIETDAIEQNGVSSMARLNYRFQNRYLLTLTARRDGSSVFGAEKKFGVFPSVALGWILSDEAFLKDREALNLLKLRLSYGAVGNQAVDPYQSLSRSATAQYVFGSATANALFPDPARMANATLGWETTQAFNAAVDFKLWADRLGGTVEYYDMKTTDLLLSRSLPVMTGFRATTANLGETSNKGVEVTLNTVNLRRDKLEWGSALTFSTNRNRIVHLYNSDLNNDGQEDSDIANKWFIGHPIGVTYDYQFDGIYQVDEALPAGYQPGWVRVQDLTGDNRITPDDRTVLGQTQPKYRWGINNYVNYGGLSLSFFINGMQGWESDFNLLNVNNNFPGRSVNALDAGYWTPENRSNTRPGLTYTNPLGMSHYLSRDFVRLQDVTLGYDFPAALTDKLKLGSLRVYVSGRNLATITDWLGTDPESGYNNINNFYPTSRTVIGGLNVSF
jgi:TonB-dependent starch-binding outer membrane protein SusC